MSDKRLISVPLTEISTGDQEVIGSLYPHKGSIYQWTKNASTGNIHRRGPCILKTVATASMIGQRVCLADSDLGWGACAPAGAAMTTIYASGSNTGCYGWVLRKGYLAVNQAQIATALVEGTIAIASAALTYAWMPIDMEIATGATTGVEYLARILMKGAVNLAATAATSGGNNAAGNETTSEVIAFIQCL